MSGIPEMFNPNEFTEKELVKLIYRDLVRLRQDFDDFVKNDTVHKELAELRAKISTLEAELKIEKQLRVEKEKTNKKIVGVLALVFTALQIGINLLINVFKK